MHDILLVGVTQRFGDPGDDRQHLGHRQQRIGLGVRHEIPPLQEFHRDVGQVMLFARVVDGDDVRVGQAARGFRLAEKALLDLDQLVALELLRQGHGLDRDHAADLRILAEVDNTHRALAELLFHLVAPEHRFFHAAALEHHGAAGMSLRAAEDHGLRQRLGAGQALLEVAEFRIEFGHVAEHRLGLVELALALEIEGQAVEVFHHRIIERALAELVPGQVQLALGLVGDAQHPVRLRGLGVRFFLAAFGHQETLGGQCGIADGEQRNRAHQLYPHQLAHHQPEMRADQRDADDETDHRGNAGLQPRQQQDQVQRHGEEHAELHPDAPGRRNEKVLAEDAGHGMCQGQHRGRCRRYGSHLRGTQAGRRGTDQHDLVPVLGHRHLAADHVEERIHGKRRTAVAVGVEKRVHPQFGIGGHTELAELQRLAPDRLDVGNAQVQAARRHHHRQRRKCLVVVAHQQRLRAHGAVDIDVGIEVPDARHRRSEFGHRVQRKHARRRQGINPLRHRHAAVQHVGRQRLVRVALRLGQLLEHHRQHHIAGGLHAAGQFAVGIEGILRLGQHGADPGQSLAGRGRLGIGGDLCRQFIVQVQQFLDIHQPGVALRLEEEGGVGDHLGLGPGQQVNHAGMDVPRPRPASDVGDAGIVDGDHGNAIGGRTRGRLDTEVVGLALQALDQVAARRNQHHDGHDEPQKPVRLPETQLCHPFAPVPCRFYVCRERLNDGVSQILRYPFLKIAFF